MTDTSEKIYKRSNEPIFWGLFGAGGMLTAILSPVMILIVGILIPIGLMSPENLSYDKIHGFAATWYGFAILFGLIALPMWHTMHRIFHSLHDLGVNKGRSIQMLICYGFAFAVTVFVFTILLQIYY